MKFKDNSRTPEISTVGIYVRMILRREKAYLHVYIISQVLI